MEEQVKNLQFNFKKYDQWKQTRFNQFINSIEGINPKTLSIRLKEMEKLGLIERKVFPNETPIRIEYYPTKNILSNQL